MGGHNLEIMKIYRPITGLYSIIYRWSRPFRKQRLHVFRFSQYLDPTFGL